VYLIQHIKEFLKLDIIKKKIKLQLNWAEKRFEDFTTQELRLLYAKINYVAPLDTVTYLMDGKDFETILTNVNNEFRKTKNGKSNLISRKNKKGGLWKNCFKLVGLMDIRGFLKAITHYYGANEKYDCPLVEQINILNHMTPKDCLLSDNHFNKFVKKTFNSYPYITKFRKPNNEQIMNLRISALLSKIETRFNADLSNKCKIFNGNQIKKWPNFKIIYYLLLICYILLGIDRQVKRYPSEFEDLKEPDISFDFVKEEMIIESKNLIKSIENINEMHREQIFI
jgi:hypothetical protein